jgi:hypothetical protein
LAVLLQLLQALLKITRHSSATRQSLQASQALRAL